MGVAALLLLLFAAPMSFASPRHPSRGVTLRAALGGSREVLEFNQGVDIAPHQVCTGIVIGPSAERLPDDAAPLHDAPLTAESLASRAPPAR